MSAMLGSAQDDASKLRNRIEELERRNAELLAFVDEYVEAWDDSMAGDSYLYRMANAIKAKYSAQSPSQEKGQQ